MLYARDVTQTQTQTHFVLFEFELLWFEDVFALLWFGDLFALWFEGEFAG